MGRQPADLLERDGFEAVKRSIPAAMSQHLQRLLGRGFLLAQAMERWRARAIWVVTRADDEYPRRIKKLMRAATPPVLYGCGELGILDGGALAVVGSRRVSEDLVRYTESVGSLAANGDLTIVSGGARGVDQAAMRGSLEAGGRAVGVLADGLDRAAVSRYNRAPLMDGRLVVVCPYDPSVRFLPWNAMGRNKLIYALADAALVVNSDHGRGGTWAGAIEQLDKLRFGPVYVRRSGEPCAGLEALARRGARSWPDPQTPADLREAVLGDPAPVQEPAGSLQLRLFELQEAAQAPPTTKCEAVVTPDPEGAVSVEDSLPSTKAASPLATKAGNRLLPQMAGEMTRGEIRVALGLKNWGHVKKRYVDPCLDEGWIEMTNRQKPRSPKQRFRRTVAGRSLAARLKDV
ncbi:MAG: DNA-processing protein DprA [Bryobacterales bacterium]|nr:DNA-processing protein DprA [Bryobacterales bacterium]